MGVGFKRADAPHDTPSTCIALKDAKLDALYVVYPGLHRYKLADWAEAVPLWAMSPAPAPEGPTEFKGHFAGRAGLPVSIGVCPAFNSKIDFKFDLIQKERP